jgi:hypothetical protein
MPAILIFYPEDGSSITTQKGMRTSQLIYLFIHLFLLQALAVYRMLSWQH